MQGFFHCCMVVLGKKSIFISKSIKKYCSTFMYSTLKLNRQRKNIFFYGIFICFFIIFVAAILFKCYFAIEGPV